MLFCAIAHCSRHLDNINFNECMTLTLHNNYVLNLMSMPWCARNRNHHNDINNGSIPALLWSVLACLQGHWQYIQAVRIISRVLLLQVHSELWQTKYYEYALLPCYTATQYAIFTLYDRCVAIISNWKWAQWDRPRTPGVDSIKIRHIISTGNPFVFPILVRLHLYIESGPRIGAGI